MCRALYTGRKYLKKKVVLINENTQINCISDVLMKNEIYKTSINHL